MSHYQIAVENPNYEAYIGWDAVRRTFFFNVCDPSKILEDPGYFIERLGVRPDEIWSLETLDSTVAMYRAGGIPREVATALQHEMVGGSLSSPEEVQQFIEVAANPTQSPYRCGCGRIHPSNARGFHH